MALIAEWNKTDVRGINQNDYAVNMVFQLREVKSVSAVPVGAGIGEGSGLALTSDQSQNVEV